MCRLANNAALGGFNEADEGLNFGRMGEFFLELIESLGGIKFGVVENFPSLFEDFNGFVGKVFTLQADEIDTANFGGITVGNEIRWDVLDDFGASADHRMLTDAAKLMHRRQATDHSMVFDRHMSSQRPII